jgi:hypothetical protein
MDSLLWERGWGEGLLSFVSQPDEILLAAQNSWTLSELIAALNRLLSDVQAEDMIGQVRWLNEWKA